MAQLRFRYLGLTRAAWQAVASDAAALGIRIPVRHRLQIGWSSYWLGLAARAQQLQSPEPAHATPSFVAGFWRSGTSLLHELLALDPQWSVLTTRQCMNPAALQLAPRAQGRSIERPMDAMRIEASTPQECEFASLLLGSPSFYRVLLLPESWERQLRWLDLEAYDADEQQRWLRDLRMLMSFAHRADPRPLLLKSPTHAFRLAQLGRLFPGTQVIAIERDPRAVLRSNLTLWRSLFALYALSPADDARLLPRLLDLYARYVQQTVAAVPSWSPETLVAIRYEALIEDPVACLRGAYARLGWTFTPEYAQRLAQEWQQRRDFQTRRPPPVAEDDERIEASARPLHAQLQAALQPFRSGH